MRPIKILLVDDHALFRAGLKSLLLAKTELEIIGEVEDGDAVLSFCDHKAVDLVILDINLPSIDGIMVTQLMRSQHPNIPILGLTSHDEVSTIRKMIKAGAAGYLLKDSLPKELIRAIKTLTVGGSYYSATVSDKLFRQSQNYNPSINKKIAITRRELEILQYVVSEMTNQEIAERLFISPRTVETHKRNLIQKLKVKNTIGLVKYYLGLGLPQNTSVA